MGEVIIKKQYLGTTPLNAFYLENTKINRLMGYQYSVPTSSLFAWYDYSSYDSGSGVWSDKSGNNYNLIRRFAGDSDGGTAVDFNGSASYYMPIATSSLFDTISPPFSIVMFVKPEAGIRDNFDDAPIGQQITSFVSQSSGTIPNINRFYPFSFYKLSAEQGTYSGSLGIDPPFGESSPQYQGKFMLTSSQWEMITITNDGAQDLYNRTTEIHSNILYFPTVSSVSGINYTFGLHVGNGGTGDNPYNAGWSGSIGAVLYYNKVLDSTELQNLSEYYSSSYGYY